MKFSGPQAALLVLAGPAWFTFFSAYQDGLDAQARGDHALAAQAFRRAIAMEPTPGVEVKTYGLNFFPTYYPYLRLAESALALGDLAGAERALALSGRIGREPASERDALWARYRKALAPAEPSAAPTVAPRLPAAAPTVASRLAATPPRPQVPGASLRPAAPVPVPVPVAASAAPEGPPPPTHEPAALRPRPNAEPMAGARPAAPSGNGARASQAGSGAAAAPGPGSGALSARPSAPSPPAPDRTAWPWALSGAGIVCGILAAFLWPGRRRILPGPPPGAKDPNLRREFGPYRPLRMLGEGGCATAYQGVHRRTGEVVAIKVPHQHLVGDPQFRARFRREASLGARLDHPRIVRVLTPEPREDDLWLAMPFIEGVTLEAFLREKGALPIPQAARIGLEVAEAIAHAHERSVVHRDLKPANIMLNAQGAMVMDFGIARVLDGARTTSTLFLGTPAYAAPESLVHPQVGPPADRYALGLILFEMLCGRPPFADPSPFKVLEAHRSQPLPDPRSQAPGLPEPLARLVERLCSKDPAERPEDLETLAVLRSLIP